MAASDPVAQLLTAAQSQSSRVSELVQSATPRLRPTPRAAAPAGEPAGDSSTTMGAAPEVRAARLAALRSFQMPDNVII